MAKKSKKAIKQNNDKSLYKFKLQTVAKFYNTGIRKNRANFTKNEKIKLSHLYNNIKHLIPQKTTRINPLTKKRETKIKDNHAFIKTNDTALKNKLKKAGLKVVDKGYFLPKSYDRKTKKQIKSAKISVLKSGVISKTARGRHEYIYFFTTAEKRKLATQGPSYIITIYNNVLDKNPTIKKMARFHDPIFKLQYGKYSGTGDYGDIESLNNYINELGAKTKLVTGLKIIFIK